MTHWKHQKNADLKAGNALVGKFCYGQPPEKPKGATGRVIAAVGYGVFLVHSGDVQMRVTAEEMTANQWWFLESEEMRDTIACARLAKHMRGEL